MTAIEFENVSKQYRLGLVSTGTIAADLNRFWQMKVLGKEDPYLKIGETNDRATKGDSEYVWALKDINFKVEQGDVVGIIGRNGAGKSTLNRRRSPQRSQRWRQNLSATARRNTACRRTAFCRGGV